MLAEVDQRVDGQGRQRPEGEEDRTVTAAIERSRRPAKAPRERGEEEAHADEERLPEPDDVLRPAAAEERRRVDRRLVELDGRGDVPLGPGQPQHRPEPGRRRQPDETEPGEHRARPPEPPPCHPEPERAEDHQHRLAHAPGETEQQGRADEGADAAPAHPPRAERHAGRERGLGGVGEADHAVRPEERARREAERGGGGDAPAVEPPPQAVDQEHRERARSDGQPPEGRGRVPEHGRQQPAERHVEDVARGVRLVPDDVVVSEGKRELDRVPGRQEAGPVGPAGRERQGRDAQRQGPVRPGHGGRRSGPGRRGRDGHVRDGHWVGEGVGRGTSEAASVGLRRPSSPREASPPSRSAPPRSGPA